ncbi:MAG: hypothetical protein HFE78_06450 [Clostridiales bacterium]|nr:hypothetical protein [Clostridiales bacterium]
MYHTRNFTAVPHTENIRNRAVSKPKTVSPYTALAFKIFNRVKLHLVLYTFCFYVLPLILSSAGQRSVLLALVYPALNFVLTLSYGFRYGFIKHYIAIPLLLFLPASFLFFKAYSYLFALSYLLILCIALTIGALYRQFVK